MITFPPEFQPVTLYPGYYWNTKTNKLFSIKISGILKELRLNRVHGVAHSRGAFLGIPVGTPYYSISHKGRRISLTVDVLKGLNEHKVDYVVPVQTKMVFAK